MYCTPPEMLQARKTHRCMSCGELVNLGGRYVRWRCYDGDDAGTVKMHPECHAAHQADAQGGQWEFTPFSYDRPARDCGEAGHTEGRCGNASCL